MVSAPSPHRRPNAPGCWQSCWPGCGRSSASRSISPIPMTRCWAVDRVRCPIATGPERAAGCARGHARRWRARGRPAMAVFLADPGPTLNGRRDLMPCSVSGCRYGSSGSGLCMRHRSAWTRDGRPDPDGWAARAGLLGPPDPSAVPAAVLHAVDRERPESVLQGPRDTVEAIGPPRSRGLPHALPAARQGPHRLPRAGAAARTRAAVRGSVSPRPGHDHHRGAGRDVGDPHRPPTPG